MASEAASDMSLCSEGWGGLCGFLRVQVRRELSPGMAWGRGQRQISLRLKTGGRKGENKSLSLPLYSTLKPGFCKYAFM